MDQAILSQLKPGAQVKVHEIVKETAPAAGKGKKAKEEAKTRTRTSVFSGIVLARKHGTEPGASFTVRSVIAGEGVEKIYPLHSPAIAKVEIVAAPKKVHRAKLYYLRNVSQKKARRKLQAL
jgi:large subunit ribosomal protein L19